MIIKTELMKVAEVKHLSLRNAERDYLRLSNFIN